jgi:simple sugar transport system permease protein
MRAVAKALLSRPEVGVVVIIILAVIGFQAMAPAFLSANGVRVILGIAPEVGIVAIGVAILMIAGEYDLSVGATFALAPMLGVVLSQMGLDPYLAFGLGLVASLAVGLANALITITFNIPSFIVTLGIMFIVRSIVVLLAGGMPPPLPADLPEEIFIGFFGPFRASLFWYLAIILLAALMLSRSNLGNWIYATGGDAQAARDLGVSVRKVKIICFMLCSLLAGFAGIIQSLRVHAAITSLGLGVELQAIAAAVIGGTALRGGVGSVLGAVFGALLIRIIDNGLIMSRIDANWFMMAVGILTIAAVVFNEVLRRQAMRIRV